MRQNNRAQLMLYKFVDFFRIKFHLEALIMTSTQQQAC